MNSRITPARWQQTIAWASRQAWLIAILIFLVAAVPRLCNLDAFLTADEDDQVRFAAGFMNAALAGDWARAVLLGYPGVPSMVLGGLGLVGRYALHAWGWLPLPGNAVDLTDALNRVSEYPLVSIPAARVAMALAASLAIVGMYELMRRLLGRRVALLAALLIAFDPWFMAHTRILHVDAPLTYFMFLSFLAFWLYLARGGWGWLALSGVCGALATLSKTPGAILGVILIVSGLIYAIHPAVPAADRVAVETPARLRWRRFVAALAVWVVVAGVAFYALWPSMWVDPARALNWITENVRIAMQTNHPTTGVFWGADSPRPPVMDNPVSDLVRAKLPRLLRGADRNPLYYAISLPFHLSPLTCLGLLVGLVATWRSRRQRPLLLALWLYAILFIVPVSLVGRRGDRYILPVYPALDLLAAMALAWLVQLTGPAPGAEQASSGHARAASRRLTSGRRRWLLAVLLMAQVLGVLWLHPYYFNYFNPLLGGGLTAPYLINVGWGEGLDRAASYLNQLPGASQANVAAWYSGQFAPFFKGQTIDMASNEPALTADYSVLYINQWQRGFPSGELLAYFGERQPLYSVQLGGISYAQVYPGPVISFARRPEVPYPVGAVLGGAVRLLGYALSQPAIHADDTLDVTLYWEVLASMRRDYNVTIRVVDQDGNTWGQVDRMPIGGLWRTHEWQPGAFIRDEYRLRLRPGTPPDVYQLDIAMYRFTTGETFGVARHVGQLEVLPARSFPAPETLTMQHSVRKMLAPGLELLGYDLGAEKIGPGERLPITLYWRATRTPGAEYAISFDAKSVAGKEGGSWQEALAPAHYPTSQWRAGEVVVSRHQLQMPAYARSGFYVFSLRLVNIASGEELGREILGKMEFVERARNFETPAVQHALGIDLGGLVQLIGYDLPVSEVPAGQTFPLTLYWRSLAETKTSYTVFIHVVGPDGIIRGQWDSVPGAGSLPTSGWLKGEVITDSYQVPLAQDAPPWRYTILVGMYDPVSGERLRETGGLGRDAIPLGTIQVRSER